MIKKILKITSCLILILLFFIIALPTILSQPIVNQFILGQINTRIPGKISAKELHLGWSSGIDLQELSVKDPKGREVMGLKRLQLNDSLFSLISAPSQFGHLLIDSPNCLLIEEQDGSYSIEHLFSSPEKNKEKQKSASKKRAKHSTSSSSTPTVFPLFTEVTVENGYLSLEKSNDPPIVVNTISCKLIIHGTQDAQLTASAVIKQGEKNGTINIDAHAEHFQDLVSAYQQKFLGTRSSSVPIIEPNINLKCSINAFPVEIADSIISISNPAIRGLLLSAIGGTVDAQLQHHYSATDLNASFTIKSQNIESMFALQTVDNSLQLSAPATFRFQLSPLFFKKLIPNDNYTLTQATTMQCTMKPMAIPLPLSPTQSALCTLNFDSPFIFKNRKGEFRLQPNITLETSSFQELIKASARLQMNAPNIAAMIACTVDVKNILTDAATVELHLDTGGNLEAMASLMNADTQPLQEVASKELNLHLDAAFNNLTKATPSCNLLLAPCRIGTFSIQEPLKVSLTLNSIKEIESLKTIKGVFEIPAITPYYQNKSVGSYAITLPFEASEKEVKAMLDLTTTAKDLRCSMNIHFADGVIAALDNKKPAVFTMQLNHDRLQTITDFLKNNKQNKQPNVTILEGKNSSLEFSCNKLRIPILQLIQNGCNDAKGLDGIDLDATVKIDALAFQTLPEKQNYTIAPLKGQITLKQASRKLLFELQPEPSSTTETTVSVKGHVFNLWDDTGLTPKNAHIEIDANLNELPIDLLQRLSCSKESGEKIMALLGPKLNATAKAKIEQLHEGVVEADVRSKYLHTTFSSTLKNGTLQLTKPATARLEITPEAGKILFKGVNPTIATAILVKAPITITIDDKGFALPIKSFSKQAIRMNMIRVDLGQMEVKKGGVLEVISTLLSLNSGNDMHLWFTPLYLEIANGVITCKRIDALLNNQLQIASWGTVDIVNDRVDMVVGILGEGLRRSLYLQTLSPNYVLQLPIKGSMAAASIDKTRATAKIASLRMREGTNQTQALIGGLLGVVASVGEEDAPIPPPTTQPFPWK